MTLELNTNRLSVQVPLVQSRSGDEGRMVVSARQTDRIDASDLVALASQIQDARELVKGRACDRLRDIARQMEQLQMAARCVLEDAKRDEDLHQVACNMQKQPGRIYHLYQSGQTGQRFFSMLAPHEWGTEEKLDEYVDSYRLEYDRSWTPLKEAAKKDQEVSRIRSVVQQGASISWMQ